MDRSNPAVAELSQITRWVGWRWETRNSKTTKPPVQPDESYAKTDDASTWSSFDSCRAAAERSKRIDGVGFVLGDGICGVDLDQAIDPETNQLREWAAKIVAEFRSYTETSPSGTGVKIFCRCDPVPELSAHVLTIARRSDDKDEQVEIYTGGRYFCVTGQHLNGTPDTIEDCTEAFERLAHRIRTADPPGQSSTPGKTSRSLPPTDDLPVRFREVLASDSEIRDCWENGSKLGKGSDTSASGIEFSLMVRLAPLLDDDDLTDVLGKFAFGQLATLSGKRRCRRLDRLLDAAARVRQRATRISIYIRTGLLHETIQEAERALALVDGIYQRGNLLVRSARLQDPVFTAPVTRPVDSLVIIPIDPDFAVVVLSEAASWWKFDARSEDWVAADPPKSVAAGLLASSGRWRDLLVLRAVTEIPIITPDGRIIGEPGLDRPTGVLFDPGNASFPAIQDHPNREDALKALETLRSIIADFPFEDGAAESVVLSAILTPFVRPCLRSAPMFAFNAHKMGSGKTLLATIVSLIATGRAPAIISQADDTESEKKRLLAVLIEGSAVTVIDNVERPIKSDAMCSILTEPVFKDRLLGANKTVTVPTTTTWIVTGNNLLFAGDLSTRVLVATLDPTSERPEERRFSVDLHQEVPARRSELVHACLTIMRAYFVAGQPIERLPVYGRFEEWSKWCREPLVWLDMDDPCASRRKVEERDPVRDNLSALLRACHGLFGTSPQTVGAMISVSESNGAEVSGRAELYALLCEAIAAIAEERGSINRRKLGNFISKHEMRWEGGLRFVKSGSSGHAVQWAVEVSGEFGEFEEFAEGSDRKLSETEN